MNSPPFSLHTDANPVVATVELFQNSLIHIWGDDGSLFTDDKELLELAKRVFELGSTIKKRVHANRTD